MKIEDRMINMGWHGFSSCAEVNSHRIMVRSKNVVTSFTGDLVLSRAEDKVKDIVPSRWKKVHLLHFVISHDGHQLTRHR